MALSRTEFSKEIGTRFRQIRLELGYTQEQMSAFFGLRRAGYRRYEGGETMPGLQALKMLSDNFNVSMEWLIRGEGAMYREIAKNPVIDPAVEDAREELRDLIVHMEQIPLLRFKILSYYHQFKMDNTDLFPDN
jgi:transcriptional regulator with XRE-family HTH domain